MGGGRFSGDLARGENTVSSGGWIARKIWSTSKKARSGRKKTISVRHGPEFPGHDAFKALPAPFEIRLDFTIGEL